KKIPVSTQDFLVHVHGFPGYILHEQKSGVGSRLAEYAGGVSNGDAQLRRSGYVYSVVADTAHGNHFQVAAFFEKRPIDPVTSYAEQAIAFLCITDQFFGSEVAFLRPLSGKEA